MIPATSTTFLELINSGALAKIESPGLRSALTRYGQVLDTTSEVWNTMFPLFNDPSSAFHRAVRFSTNPDLLLPLVDHEQVIIGYEWALLKQGEAEFQNIYLMQIQGVVATHWVQDAIDQVVEELQQVQSVD
ncbi:MAG TPA: hypothetical protein DEA26_09620 [Oceanospirillales bacterium]|nr:hypothetical protein [Oceanospirillaceae bacterium]HBS42928.1 hypothetical protein [Oceanospirillales bacterium]